MAILIGCRPSVSEIGGNYKLEDPSRSGSLDLKADGTLHEVVDDKGKRIDLDGGWHFDGKYLIRKPCVDFKLDGGIGKADVCMHAIQKNFRGVLIVIHPDLPPRYYK